MEPQSFQGTYRDVDGSDDIKWTIAPSERPGWARRFEVRPAGSTLESARGSSRSSTSRQ